MRQVDKDILDLAVPSIVSNVTVPLLGLVDLTIVGHLGSEQYIAAIAVGSMIFNVIYWLFGFLRMGTSGMTSQALGRADYSSVKLLFRRSVIVALAIAACFLLVQVPLRWTALTIMHPSAQIWALASTYFNILIWGAPAVLGLYSLNGWFIGMQDTKTPMVVAVFQNVLNIAASLWLVFGWGMQIAGVALGTLLAQWGGFALALWMARDRFRKDRMLGQAVAGVGDKSVSWSSFFVVNRDIFLRTLCLVGVNLFFTSAGARQGDMILAVNTLLMTFFTLFSYVMDGFAFAAEALSGKLYGAGNGPGLRQLVRRFFAWGAVMVTVFTLAYMGGGNGFLGLITDDRAVIGAAGDYFFWACMVPAAGVAAFIYDGVFIGLTATKGMLWSSLVATGVFFGLFLVGIRVFPANHALWLSFIVYLVSRGGMQHCIIRKQIIT